MQALVRDPRLRCWSHIDERCAGFFALGAAKASCRPVVVTCTSGTAAANLVPAVIEAHEAGVPLILLTADRPPELRDIGAGQTIDQVKLYGGAVKLYAEPDLQQAGEEQLRFIRSLACRAAITAAAPRPGPVHLNLPLREPLVVSGPLPPDPGGRDGGAPWTSPHRPADAAPEVVLSRRPVLIAGELSGPPELGARLAEVAAQAGVPLLADPQSGARRGPAAIAHYDLILRDPPSTLGPDTVVRVGELPTSKPLRTWVASLGQARHVSLVPDPAWSDPASRVSDRHTGALATLIEGLTPGPVDPGWLAAWREADRHAAEAIDATLAPAGLSEPLVARTLGAELPAEATLFVASSMPIREIEEFAGVRDTPPRVLANRGANGIDGTVSSAFGAAAVTGGPVVLLIGDVALLHDLGGLLAARRTGLELTIVLLNNDGGGIFHFLPIAGQDAFAEHVATPHGVDFAHAAALFGFAHRPVGDLEGLRAALAAGGNTLIEVRTDRAENRRLHASVEAGALARLGAGGPSGQPAQSG